MSPRLPARMCTARAVSCMDDPLSPRGAHRCYVARPRDVASPLGRSPTHGARPSKAVELAIPCVFHLHAMQVVIFREAGKAARAAAYCPGRLVHDLRRTLVRELQRAGVSRSVAMK